MTSKVLYPGATIGILGGGQLGRMMAIEARQMGYRIIALDPYARCPTAQVADGIVVGALDDLDAARHLARQVDVITLDTEHVNSDILVELEKIVPVRPASSVLRTIQDRVTQKTFLGDHGIPQTPWYPVTTTRDLDAAIAKLGLPLIVKVRRAGYDGKGQVRIDAGTDAHAALAKLRGEPAVAEKVVEFAREISVVLGRGMDDSYELYPIAENVHRRHILHTTRAPAPMPAERRHGAEELARVIAYQLHHVGVIAVEMFELPDGRLLVNEIAPRTHNSGHYTYGACATSQFEQHVRAVCGLPLGDPRPLSGAVMVNLIGDLWAKGPPPWDRVLGHPEARLHLYGKDAPAPGRKMGHVLLLDNDTDRALAVAEQMIVELSPTTTTTA